VVGNLGKSCRVQTAHEAALAKACWWRERRVDMF